MQPEFWQETWVLEGSKTSFHLPNVHPYLLEHCPPPFLQGKRVFVPLAGKTRDLEYFRQHAAWAVAVELVAKPIRQFMADQHLVYEERENGLFAADRLSFYQRDLFELGAAEVGPVDLIYDRASLIAFPPEMRRRYVAKIHQLAGLGCQIFLNTLEYAPYLDEPPFSVGPDEIERSFGAAFQVEHVEAALRPGHGMQRKFGLDYVKEHLFVLTRVR